MSRWKPDARGRLQQAAMELFAERGFENTTVADVARRAGLTERTFFRHFADKREVLFWGADNLTTLLIKSVEGAPPGRPAFTVIIAALLQVAAFFDERREFARTRQAIIEGNGELRERELVKLAALADALARALRRRGAPEGTATLAAETGVAVFRVAFERWVREEDECSLTRCLQEVTGALRALTETDTSDPG